MPSLTVPPHEQYLVYGVQWRVGVECVDLSLELLPLSEVARQAGRIGLIDKAEIGRRLMSVNRCILDCLDAEIFHT